MSEMPDDPREFEPAAEVRFAVAPITNVEVRDPSGNDDNTWTMSGYAAVFDQETTLYNGKYLRLTESIDQRAFHNVLSRQPLGDASGVVHFNFGHDMNRAVAATNVPAGQPGSLVLTADDHGLRFLAKVPRDDPDGVAMAAKMRSGVLRQASFAFTVDDDEVTTRDGADGAAVEHRQILSVGHLYDVCATPQGAYPQTVASLRSYGAAIGQPPLGEATLVSRESGGESTVTPEGSGGGFKSLKAERLARDLARMKARYPQK